MNSYFSDIDFYQEMESSLATSTTSQRKIWIASIIENDIAIEDLSGLLQSDSKTTTRFLWLLSEIGLSNPDKLFKELPFLWEMSQVLQPNHKTSFANFWLIAGVPSENEGHAINQLFQWLLAPHVNVTIKSRAILVLYQLTKKYPELKNELLLCLHDQVDKYTDSFRKRTSKVILKLEQ